MTENLDTHPHYVRGFAKSVLTLIDLGPLSIKQKVAVALAALVSCNHRMGLEGLVGHHMAGALLHRNPDGTNVCVRRNPWTTIESGVQIDEDMNASTWFMAKSGSHIGKGVTFGQHTIIGMQAIVGEGMKLHDGAVIPDNWTVNPSNPTNDVSSQRPYVPSEAGSQSAVRTLMERLAQRKCREDANCRFTDEDGRLCEKGKDGTIYVDYRVQNGMDLVDLVATHINETMTPDEIVDQAYYVTNSYFFRNWGFVLRDSDTAENFSVFDKNVVRHKNPDGTVAYINRSSFGGVSETVFIDGHAHIGDWTFIGGNSRLERGAVVLKHTCAENVGVGTTVDRTLNLETPEQMQELLRGTFLTNIRSHYNTEDSDASIPAETIVVRPSKNNSEPITFRTGRETYQAIYEPYGTETESLWEQFPTPVSDEKREPFSVKVHEIELLEGGQLKPFEREDAEWKNGRNLHSCFR